MTLLLKELSNGNQQALAELVPVVYDELHRLAAYYLRRERSDHTLQATALVHEAYLQLVDQRRVDWKNRNHFFGVAAQLMRRVLLMHAREHQAAKRGLPPLGFAFMVGIKGSTSSHNLSGKSSGAI